MKTKLVIEFQDRYHSATISIVDETGNGQIVMSGAVNGGAASDEAYAKAKELLTEMVRNMNDYRTVNGYDLIPLTPPVGSTNLAKSR